ncbi:MAG: serine/threonine-protein kinase [Thermoguttaceae bacterium]
MDASHTFRNSPFVLCALASGLVSHDQIDIARGHVESEVHIDQLDEESFQKRLAAVLVELGCLNNWQVIQLQQGRTKFTLGSYRIVDSIGRGGMGQVFKGEHPVLDRQVAIKVLPRENSTPETVANFNREMKTLARLDHPNLVRAFDAGQDGSVHFLVTEYVPGKDLRKLVRARGRLDMASAASIISQVAAGLQHAHEQGLVHRDVKPGNVLVTAEGLAKLSDLGLAGPLDGGLETDPRFGKIAGTADYLSPDHIQFPSDPKPAWDIYSLGCTLYYAVTGKVPFPLPTTPEKVRAHCEHQPIDPRRFNKDLDESFVEVMWEMMAKDPARRIPTAKEVIARLRPWVPAEDHVPAPPIAPDTRPAGRDPFRMADTRVSSFDGPESGGQFSQVSQTTDRLGAAEYETDSNRELRAALERPVAVLGPLILFVAIPLGIMGLIAVAWSVFSAVN